MIICTERAATTGSCIFQNKQLYQLTEHKQAAVLCDLPRNTTVGLHDTFNIDRTLKNCCHLKNKGTRLLGRTVKQTDSIGRSAKHSARRTEIVAIVLGGKKRSRLDI